MVVEVLREDDVGAAWAKGLAQRAVVVGHALKNSMVPVITLSSQGDLKGFNTAGTLAATGAGMLGAIGAVFIIFAFRSGGLPAYVMPLVFGGAPLVNVLVSMAMHPPKESPNWPPLIVP